MRRISSFTRTLLLSLLILLVLPFVFGWGLRTKLGELFYEELYVHSIILIMTPIVIVVGFFLIADLFFPFYFDLRNLKTRPIESSLVLKDYSALLEKSGLTVIPSLMTSEKVVAPVSLGIHKGKSMIILPTYVLDMEEKERESIVMHELWHIKTDVEATYLSRFELVGGGILALVSVITAVLIIISEHNILGWWSKLYTIYFNDMGILSMTGDLYSENFPWIIFCAFVFPFCFSGIVTVLRALNGYPAYIHRDSREYLADAYAALSTRKPITVGKSIFECTNKAFLKGYRDSLTKKIGFVNPPPNRKAKSSKSGVLESLKEDFIRDFGLGFLRYLVSNREIEATSWSDILSSKFTGNKHPPWKYRVKFLYLLERLLNSTIELRSKLDPRKPTTRLKLSFLFRVSPISHGKVFSDIPAKKRWNIIEQMLENKNSFSLEPCTRATGASNEEVFLVFYLLLREGIINIVKPEMGGLDDV